MEDNSLKAAAVIEVVVTAFLIFSIFSPFQTTQRRRRGPAKCTASKPAVRQRTSVTWQFLGKLRLFLKKHELEKF